MATHGNENESEYMNARKAAHYLGMSPRSFRRKVRDNIPCYNLSGFTLYKRTELEAYIQRHKKSAVGHQDVVPSKQVAQRREAAERSLARKRLTSPSLSDVADNLIQQAKRGR